MILTVTAFASAYTVGVFLLGHSPCKRRLVASSYADTPACPSEWIVEHVVEPSHWPGVLNDWANFRTKYKLEHLGSKGYLSALLVTKITGADKRKKSRTASKTEIPVDSSAQVTFSNESLLQNPAINSPRVGHLITSGLLKSKEKY